MSDLHQRALACLDPVEPFSESVYDALRAVLELHAPRLCRGFPDDMCLHLAAHYVCTTCGPSAAYVIGDPHSTARCTTVRAIARELGIEVAA